MKKAITYLLFSGLSTLQAQTDSILWTDQEDTSRIKITKLDLNSSEEDFCPMMCNNKLYFTSAKPSSFGIVFKEAGTEHNTNIYYADKKDSIHFSNPKSLI